jgi:hypothetical protein
MSKAIALKSGTKMNSLEQAYAANLNVGISTGQLLDWKYEGLKFRLAKRTWYTPDFVVLHKDLHLSIDEVKGFWRDDARVKIKCAAEMFPWFEFRAISSNGRDWDVEQFGPPHSL